METTKTALSDQLIAARESISDPRRWIRGWFNIIRGELCMCAHGAAQAQCNPMIRSAWHTGAWHTVTTRGGTAAGSAHFARQNGEAPSDIWTNRPNYVKNDRVWDGKNLGNLDLHWILGMVGLTIGFNDHPDTTHQMVMDKFDQAIALAKQFESLGLA